MLVADPGQLAAVDPFHRKVRAPIARHSPVEDLGDRRVRQSGEGAALGLEAGDDGRIARTADLDGDPPEDRIDLLGQVDAAHAAFADLVEDVVMRDLLSDHVALVVAGR